MTEATETATANGAEIKPENPGRILPGNRLSQMLAYLTRERADSLEMVFTAEHAAQVKSEFGMNSGQIYTKLKDLQKKGFIARKNLAKGMGVQITFLDRRSNTPKANGQPKGKRGDRTIEAIRTAAKNDIIGLEAKIAEKKEFLAELDAYEKLIEKKEA